MTLLWTLGTIKTFFIVASLLALTFSLPKCYRYFSKSRNTKKAVIQIPILIQWFQNGEGQNREEKTMLLLQLQLFYLVCTYNNNS